MANYIITALGKESREVSKFEMQREYGRLLSPAIMSMPIVKEAVVIKDGYTVTIRKVAENVRTN